MRNFKTDALTLRVMSLTNDLLFLTRFDGTGVREKQLENENFVARS